jgi:hypothetical protein
MTLRLAVNQAEDLEKVAEIEDLPVSEAVRTAIDAYIDARRSDPVFQGRLKRALEQDREILRRLGTE